MELLSYPGSVLAIADVPAIPAPPTIADKFDFESVLPMVVIGLGISIGLIALLVFIRRPSGGARRTAGGRRLTADEPHTTGRRRRRRSHRPKALSVGQTGGLPPIRTGSNQSPPA